MTHTLATRLFFGTLAFVCLVAIGLGAYARSHPTPLLPEATLGTLGLLSWATFFWCLSQIAFPNGIES